MAKESYQEQLAELNRLARTLMKEDMHKEEDNNTLNAFRIYYTLLSKEFHQPINHGQMEYERRGLKITYNTTREALFDVTIDENKWFAVSRVRRTLSDLLNSLEKIKNG